MSPSFATSWLAGDQNARRLLPGAMLDSRQRGQVAQAALERGIHPGAAQALRDLNRQLPPRPLRDAHVELLTTGRAVASSRARR